MFSFILIPLVAFGVCALLGPVLIPFLHKLKFGQMIREVGPASHAKKSGTPTMGGIMILAAIVISILWLGKLTPAVMVALALTLGHGLIGFIDDFIKVVMKRNLGLTERQKFFLQFLLAGAYIWYAANYIQDTTIWVPIFNIEFDMGNAYYVLVFILIVGTTNAVNLTDGLDGLVSFVTLPVATAFAAICMWDQIFDLAGFAFAVFGSCLGFLLFNVHPAKVFMGDTGSLALGGAVAALALLTKTELLLVIIGGVYVAEASSVILQVAYFKITHGKRIFRMSPLHHHFELGGWNDVKWKETKVVTVFALASCLLSMLGYWLWVIA